MTLSGLLRELFLGAKRRGEDLGLCMSTVWRWQWTALRGLDMKRLGNETST